MHASQLVLLLCPSDPDDYFGGSFPVPIPPGSLKVTLNVSTLRDNILETAEYFKATLSLPGAPEGCIVGTPDMSYITIQDNTRMLGLNSMPPLMLTLNSSSSSSFMQLKISSFPLKMLTIW